MAVPGKAACGGHSQTDVLACIPLQSLAELLIRALPRLRSGPLHEVTTLMLLLLYDNGFKYTCTVRGRAACGRAPSWPLILHALRVLAGTTAQPLQHSLRPELCPLLVHIPSLATNLPVCPLQVHLLACYQDMLGAVVVSRDPAHPLTTALDRLTVQLFNSEEVTVK